MTRCISVFCFINLIFLSSIVWSQSADLDAEPQTAPEVAENVLTEDQIEAKAYLEWAQQFLASLTPLTGEIKLAGGKTSLLVPADYYYLSPEDSKRVLEEAWGNPEDDLILGMLFPARYTVLDDDAWGVALSYVDDGYVSDKDAADINYDELLSEMTSDTLEESNWRLENGYEPIELIGWAEKPYYDQTTNKLYWAKEIRFGDSEVNTLNYSVRALGRQGYLEMNFIAGMNQLDEINQDREKVLAMSNFNPGSTYSEFNPDIDKVAAYGIGGLIAGKVLAKAGLLAVALVFLKKFWFLLFLPLVWLKGKIFPKKAEQ